MDFNNCDSRLWTYVIDNCNNGYLGIYRLYVGFGIQGICVYVTYIPYGVEEASVYLIQFEKKFIKYYKDSKKSEKGR